VKYFCSFKNRISEEQEAGFGLMEILVAISLMALVSLGIAANTMAALRIVKKTEVNYLASNLALSKIEELAAYEAADLDATFDGHETSLAMSGTSITFSRTTTIIINADNSRTVTVVVASESPVVPTSVDFSTTYALWE